MLTAARFAAIAAVGVALLAAAACGDGGTNPSAANGYAAGHSGAGLGCLRLAGGDGGSHAKSTACEHAGAARGDRNDTARAVYAAASTASAHSHADPSANRRAAHGHARGYGDARTARDQNHRARGRSDRPADAHDQIVATGIELMLGPGGQLIPGAGHWHIGIDSALLPEPHDGTAFQIGPLDPGPRTITVTLNLNDADLTVVAIDGITVTVVE